MTNLNERVIAGMAVLPERLPHFDDIAERVLPQVDKLVVSINKEEPQHPLFKEDKIEVAEWRSRGDDARKFEALWSHSGDFYFFSMDDDLLYPEDYVGRMIRFIRYWNNRIVACVHGSWVEELPINSYYKDKKATHFAHPLDEPRQVLFPGTGTTAWHTSAMNPGEGKYPMRNIADVQTGLAAQGASVPVLSIPRENNWLSQHPKINALEDSIWATRKDADDPETRLINSFESAVGWEFPPLPSRRSQEQA